MSLVFCYSLVVFSQCLIYALHHPDSDRVYVGQSSSGMFRPKNHGMASNLRRAKSPVHKWIRKLRSCGKDYEIVVLEECPSRVELNEAERFHIAYFRSLGVLLLNCTDGGDCASTVISDETRAKIGAVHRGKKRSIETRARISEAKRNMSFETRARMVAAWNNHTEEDKSVISKKMSEAQKKRPPPSLESRLKTSATMKGVPKGPRTAEHRENLSKALKGRKMVLTKPRGPLSITHKEHIGLATRNDKVGQKRRAEGLRRWWATVRLRDNRVLVGSGQIATVHDIERAVSLRKEGLTLKEIAEMIKISKSSVARIISQASQSQS